MEAQILLQTDKSSLKKYVFNDNVLLANCVNDTDPKLLINPKIKIYNKECIQHRDVGLFSDVVESYDYSGQTMYSEKYTDNLRKLQDAVNAMFNSTYNATFVNKYNSGEDYISAHADNEHRLDKNAGVVCISYGEKRKFRIRNKNDKKIVLDTYLESNDLVQMDGDFQQEFTHEIPVEKTVKGVRYSFTFRTHL
ncbi:MAG: alkylated (methylated) DNA repair protein [Terrestrivirus sp.]|uniref:Alkylated (Methylated) DNA repair protein n=1 Tax=Terrestrivirus sp. TaxID=2487775 RepID=A0A3G4ZK74_9VIRU|nr:MAG: alkylated (methylated) DNA repair protein [Terrestrivirus sp.]